MDLTLSVINGTTRSYEKDIPVGKCPIHIAVSDNTDTIYAADSNSDGISVIDGITKNVVAGVAFNINPANSGQITCNNITPPINQYLYVWSGTRCAAVPNKGFEFSSWVENLNHNATRTLSTTAVSDSQLTSLLDIFGIKPNNMATTLNVTKFGAFTAIFKALPPPIPPEYLLAIFGLTVSFIIPSLFRWLNGWRQRRNLDDYIKKLPSKLNQNEAEKEIRGLYIKGKISEPHLKILNEMIATKFKA